MSIYLIRNAKADDLGDIAYIEETCFPHEEAATREQLEKRLNSFGSHFYVLEYAGRIVGFIEGMVTDDETISDDMYGNETLHKEDGKWQSVFGLDVLEGFRKMGFASNLLNEMIKAAKEEKRLGVILTCKEHLIHFYEKFGFKNCGISESVHGGVVWYDMRLTF